MGMQQTNTSETSNPLQEYRDEQERRKQREKEQRLRRHTFYAEDRRPAASDTTVDGSPMWGDGLEKVQAAYDESRSTWAAFDAQMKPMKEAEEARKREAEEAQTAREEAERQEARQLLLAPAMAAFLASGGAPEEWEAQKDTIEADIRRERATRAALGGNGGLTDDQVRAQRHFNRSF